MYLRILFAVVNKGELWGLGEISDARRVKKPVETNFYGQCEMNYICTVPQVYEIPTSMLKQC